jgi:DNA-binding transcriptional regulator YiaG
MSALAGRIRKARDAAVLTQVELAERLGVSQRTLQGWEAGMSFPQPRHRRLLLAFIAEHEEVAA